MPLYTNPAEFIIDLVNTDFATNREQADEELEKLQNAWASSKNAATIIQETSRDWSVQSSISLHASEESANRFVLLAALMHRSFVKSYRDVIAYGIRIAMYMGLAVMMGTVWLRLGQTQEHIQSFTNAIVRFQH
jgi:hypothetical protein